MMILAALPTQIPPLRPANEPKGSSPADIDQKLARTWKKFGWTSDPSLQHNPAAPVRDLSSILTDYPDCAHFLRESGLLYTIRGYQHTLNQATGPIDLALSRLQEGITLDQDGHPLLLKEGQWTRWEDLKNLFRYDSVKKEVVSIADPEQEWNYFAPHGLFPKSRYNEIYPVYQLTDGDMQALQIQGEKYFQGNVPQAVEEHRGQWRYLQVFTSDNSMFSKLSHVGLRLINENGEVYSLGYETPNSEIPFTEQYFVATYDASITTLDYDEFKPFKTRRVTTIPLTEGQYRAAFDRIEGYANKPLRFNRLHQNCTTYVTDIMKAAGHSIDVTCTLIDGLPSLAPRIKDIPYIGPVIHGIKQCAYAAIAFFVNTFLPGFVTRTLETLVNTVSAIAVKIFSVITNLFSLLFGGNKGSDAIEDLEDKTIHNKNGLQYFDRLITKPIDVFRNEPAKIYAPTKLVEWQLDQESTFYHKHDGSPRLTIVPIEDIEDKTIHNKNGLQHFDRLITKPIDVFRNEPAKIYAPTKLVKWQLDQESTFYHKHDGSPSLTIVSKGV